MDVLGWSVRWAFPKFCLDCNLELLHVLLFNLVNKVNMIFSERNEVIDFKVLFNHRYKSKWCHFAIDLHYWNSPTATTDSKKFLITVFFPEDF